MSATDPDLQSGRPRQEPPWWFVIAVLLLIGWAIDSLAEVLVEVIR